MKVTLVLALILISGCMTEKITYVQNHKIMLDSNGKVKELIPAGHAEKID